MNYQNKESNTDLRRVLINTEVRSDQLLKMKAHFPTLTFTSTSDKQEVEHFIQDAEILIVFKCPNEIIEKGKNLKWVHILRSGLDGSDVKGILQKNLLLTNSKGIHKNIMAEYAIAAMIMTNRMWPFMISEQTKRNWNSNIPQDKIQGKTLGIIGFGEVGKEVAMRAQTFDMKVVAYRRTITEDPMILGIDYEESIETILSECDFVLDLLPLNDDTKYWFDLSKFNLMKESAVFINMGRGGTVVETDLLKILREKKIRGAVLDVFQEEPLPVSSPFWDLDNVIITPHKSGDQQDYFGLAYEIIEYNLNKYMAAEHFDMINRIE